MTAMPSSMKVVAAYKISSDYRRNSGDPSKNYSQAASQSEIMRAVVQIDKYRAIPIDFRIERNAHGVTDSATFTLPIAGNSDWSTVLDAEYVNGQIPVSIHVGFVDSFDPDSVDISGLSQRFSGIIDDFDPDWNADTCVFTCRSLGSILTDQKTTTASQNQTTVDFIQKTAAFFGLKSVIQLRPSIAATKSVAAQPAQMPQTLQSVYGRNFLVGLKNMRYWDIFIDCAEVDDVDVWVKDDTVYYVSADCVVSKGIGHVTSITYGTDIKILTGKHSPTYNKNISVVLRSYNPKTRFAVSVSIDTDVDGNPVKTSRARTVTTTPIFGQNASTSESTSVDENGNVANSSTASKSTGGATSTGYVGNYRESTKEIYPLRIPNISQKDADARAVAYWHQLSRNEYAISFTKVVTKANIIDIDVTTRFVLKKCPWKKFNSNQSVTPKTSKKNVPASSVGVDQGLVALGKRPYYFPRRISESGGISQGDGDSPGWIFEVEAVSHGLPQGAV